MDQAKFKDPRNLASSSQFSELWRPTLHMTGVIIHGFLELYIIMQPDCPKDANMQCTVMSIALELLYENFFKDTLYRPPRIMQCCHDNTAREGVNQTFATFLSWLGVEDVFEKTASTRLIKDHTHNELDACFSVVASSLNNAPELETPSDFAAWIRDNVRPSGGRKLFVQVLDNTWDFQTWFYGLDVHFQGLTTTPKEKRNNHVWEFCQRSVIEKFISTGVFFLGAWLVIRVNRRNRVNRFAHSTGQAWEYLHLGLGRKSIGNRTSIENQLKIDRTSIENIWKGGSVENRSNINRNSIENLWKRGSVEYLSQI